MSSQMEEIPSGQAQLGARLIGILVSGCRPIMDGACALRLERLPVRRAVAGCSSWTETMVSLSNVLATNLGTREPNALEYSTRHSLPGCSVLIALVGDILLSPWHLLLFGIDGLQQAANVPVIAWNFHRVIDAPELGRFKEQH